MKKLLQTMKAFLVLAMLCVGNMGVSARDLPYTIGSLTSGGWDVAKTDNYTLEGFGTYHLTFTTTNDQDESNHWWHTWGLVVMNGSGTDYFAYRGDGYAWHGTDYNSTANSDVFASAKSTDISGATLMNAMHNATVDMYITHLSSNISVKAVVTPTNGTNPFTMTFNYLKGDATSENIMVRLTAEYATVTLTKAEAYYNVSRYNQDMEDATNYTTGWTLNGNVAASRKSINNTYQLYFNVSKNKVQYDNTLSLSSTNNYFSTVEEYMFSFQYGYSHGNGNAYDNGLTLYAPSNVTLFSITQPGNYGGSGSTIKNASGENLATFATEYNKSEKGVFLTFVIVGSKTDNNVKLSVKNGNTTIVNNVTISNTFKTVDKLYLQTTGGASHYFFDNIVLKEHSDAAVAEDPTYAFKSVSDENRVYTITNPNGEGTLYYTTTTATDTPAVGDAAYTSTTEASVDVTFATGTYYAYAVLADGTTTSAIVSQNVTGGAITLNTPTWTKTAYNAETSTSTVTLTSNQSGKLGNPTADIYYKINDGTATKYMEPISVIDGQKLSYYATATGYTTSTEGSVTATAPCFNPNLRPVETYYRSSDGGISVNTEETEAATIGSTKYRYMYCDAKHVSEYLVTSSSGLDNWMLRSGGLYCGKAAAYAIMGVQENDYITITFGSGSESPYPTSSDGTKDEWNSTPTSYAFKVTSTNGFFRFNYGRYGYINTIRVQRAYDASATMKCTAKKYGTFAASFDVELPEGVIAYSASLNTAGNAITLTELEGTTIPAGTPVIIYSEDGLDLTPFEGYSATDVAICGDGVLKGALQSGQTIPGGSYVLQTQDGVQQFYKLTNSVKSNVNRCWIELPTDPADPAAKASLAIAPDDITGVKSVSANAKNAPMKRIVNGQLIIEKDGKQYNALGQEK